MFAIKLLIKLIIVLSFQSCGGKLGRKDIGSNKSDINFHEYFPLRPIISSVEIVGEEIIPVGNDLTAPLTGDTAPTGLWADGGYSDTNDGFPGDTNIIKTTVSNTTNFDSTEDFTVHFSFPDDNRLNDYS